MAQVDAVVPEALACNALACSKLVHQIDRVLLEQPCAVACLYVLPAAILENHAFDPVTLQQQSERQAGRTSADDRDLRPHRHREPAQSLEATSPMATTEIVACP
jgi:hypothetical protein